MLSAFSELRLATSQDRRECLPLGSRGRLLMAGTSVTISASLLDLAPVCPGVDKWNGGPAPADSAWLRIQNDRAPSLLPPGGAAP